jgi:uncharacterized membrane protein
MTAVAPDVLTEKPRIFSIDIMRGLVMVIMALDHARDFYHADAYLFDPTDLEKTNPVLFFTRFITHWCAPTFVLLSGVSIRISQQRKTKHDLSIFLLTRGLWLIVLELTVIRFGLVFQLWYDVTLLLVIWAIGISMVILSVLIHLPFKVIVWLGIFITAGHDVLNALRLNPGDPFLVPWTLTHQVGFFQLSPDYSSLVAYPFLPWLGIMLLGYGLGELYTSYYEALIRKKLLLRIGLGAIALFVVLRSVNVYGDPAPWSTQKNFIFSLMSFVNVTKYPVSLCYTLMTLGPVLIILSRMENLKIPLLKPFAIYGRVPLFYYILHFYILHLGSLILYMTSNGKSLSDIDFHFNKSFGGIPPGAGYPLIGAYIAWVTVVIVLYPACKWYNRYKSTHHDWWLSYL